MCDLKQLNEAPAAAPAEAETEATVAETAAPAPAPEAASPAAPELETAEAPAAEAPATSPQPAMPADQPGAPFVPAAQDRAGARAATPAAPAAPEDPGGSAHVPVEDETPEQTADRAGLDHLEGATVRRVDPTEEPRPATKEISVPGLVCDFLEGLGALPSAADDARRELVKWLREQDVRS